MTSERQTAYLAILVDYDSLSESELAEAVGQLPRKLVRQLASVHADNRTRKSLLRLSGVPIGSGTVVNPGIVVEDAYSGLVRIGERAAIGPGVVLIGDSGPNNSRLDSLAEVRDRLVRSSPLLIDDDAWLGAGVIVLPGVTVGSMSVVGAGTIVTQDVPSGSVVAGVPGRVLRQLAAERGRSQGLGPEDLRGRSESPPPDSDRI